MNWVLAATLAALLFTALAVISKELMDHIDSVAFTAIYSLVAFIFYTPVFIYYLSSTGIDAGTTILLLVGASALGNVFGMLAYNFGLGHTSLSTAMSLNRSQPVFVAFIGFVALGESMGLEKVSGILLVTFASYIILLEDHSEPLAPIIELVSDKGARLALLSAVFFSITSVIDRFVTASIPPEIYTYLILGIMMVTLNSYVYRRDENFFSELEKEISGNIKAYTASGIMTSLAYLSLYIAFSQAEASRVVPVLQLQVPLTIVAGREIFEEQHVLQKLAGSLLMIIGILLVV